MKMTGLHVLSVLLVAWSTLVSAQTDAPTSEPLPTEHPCVANLPDAPSCWSSLDDVWCSEWQVSQNQTMTRTYYLCPGEYIVGDPVSNDGAQPWFGGERGIFLTPNVEIICGDDGIASTDCTLTGGTFQLQATNGGEPGSNLVQGITFNQANTFTFAGGFAATQDLTFKDCAFLNNYNIFVWNIADDPDSILPITYTLEDVLFENNAVVVAGNQPGLVAMNNPAATLVLKNVIFRENSAAIEGNSVGFAVNSVGGLNMTDVCFLNNRWSVAPVISIGASTNASNIFSTEQEEALLCEFAAEVDTSNNLVCTIDNDSEICSVIGVTESPTMSPSIADSESPTTDEPTIAPVVAPTVPEEAPTPTGADSAAHGHTTMTILLASVIGLGLLVV
ncbi:unnamed protein product [Cylindrotheca closterium]|uniref:Right handed beta helix domain-containing protein n=1 Tax=Cylindrotheca closterium TaxID=2856 RepID=A0AAD2JI19_9STRA|nr:unnamed protein product [Cylindrotheca closterium]